MTKALDEANIEYRLLVMPDHPTPIRIRTHTADSIPYLLYDSTDLKAETYNYNEKEAAKTGTLVEQGYTLIDKLFEKNV